jgi:Glycosyltransferase family 9 (heptosyltransferase)
MGFGDEIIGSGLARGAHARGKKIAFGDGKKIIWSKWCAEAYENNPNVARPGQEHWPNVEWKAFHVGSRGYSTLNAAKTRWIWNYDYRMQPGEFFFTDAERAQADRYKPGFILIEPNLQWFKSVAANKDWGNGNYLELARRLQSRGYRLVQFRHANSRRIIPGAELITLPRFRTAIAVMARAALYIGAEGGMMHAAAAVGLKAVVLFGGWSPPTVVGHSWHANIVGSDEACGSVTPCRHCLDAMAKISVDEVEHASQNEIRNHAAAE